MSKMPPAKADIERQCRQKEGTSLLFAFCSNCEYEKEFYTSSQQTDKSFDVNKRIVYAMRACGQGYSGIKQ